MSYMAPSGERGSSADARPVGVLDSGLGGISILKALMEALPQEDFVYFGDSAYAPYGEKSDAWVLARTRQIADMLRQQGAKALVLACNTATSVAADAMRAESPELPIIGVEPALKPAAMELQGKRILVMATPLTLRLEKFQRLADRWGKGCEVIPVACEGLASCIEHCDPCGPEVRGLLDRHIGAYRGAVDGIVLGCTHYPFAARAIRAVIGDVPLYDGAAGTAHQLKRVLGDRGLLNASGHVGGIDLRSSSDDPQTIALYRRFLGLESYM